MYETAIDCSGDTKAAAACANRMFRNNGLETPNSVTSKPGKLIVRGFRSPPGEWLIANLRVFAKGFSAGFTAGQAPPSDEWVCNRHAEIVNEWREGAAAYIAEHGSFGS